jgi:hypothetical protein
MNSVKIFSKRDLSRVEILRRALSVTRNVEKNGKCTRQTMFT